MDALRNLYCTLILSYLSHYAMVWENTYTTNLMPLPQTEKAIGIVCNVKYRYHTSELFYDMKFLTIYQISKLQTGNFMHKAFHMKLPYDMQDHFLLKRTGYKVVARQTGSIRQTYVRTAKKQHCVSVLRFLFQRVSVEHHGVQPTGCMDNEPEPLRGVPC